jgi:hypothetical protein
MAKELLTGIVNALPESARFQVRERYWCVKSKILYESLCSRLTLSRL